MKTQLADQYASEVCNTSIVFVLNLFLERFLKHTLDNNYFF